MFKASKDGMKDTGLSFLTTPYLGPAQLKEVALAEVNNTPDCLQWTFELKGEDDKGNDVSGIEHQHVEWAVNEQDDQESIQKKIDRIAYMTSTIVPEEKIQAIEAPNWKAYCHAIIELLQSHGYTQRQLEIKVLGNVYNGKARVRFPGYNSFIKGEGGKPLTLSPREREENAKYYAAQNAAPSEPTLDVGSMNVSDLYDAGF